MYSRKRNAGDMGRSIYYGGSGGTVARPSKPFSQTGEPPAPPPFYGGTMYPTYASESPLPPIPDVSVPPLPDMPSQPEKPGNAEPNRPLCGEHARDDIPQRPGEPIGDLTFADTADMTDQLPRRIRNPVSTRQNPIGQNSLSTAGRRSDTRIRQQEKSVRSEYPSELSGILHSFQDPLRQMFHSAAPDDLLLLALTVLFLGQGGDELMTIALMWLLLS